MADEDFRGELLVFRYPKSHRLRQKNEFDQVAKKGGRYHVRGWSVYIKANSLSYPRLGVVAAKRVYPNAVDRNWIKRLVRESFRHQTELPGMDIIIAAKLDVKSMETAELNEALAKIWHHCLQRYKA